MNPYSIAEADPKAFISPSARIINYQQVSKKIIIGSQTQILGELLVYWKSGSIQIGRRSYVSTGSRIWSQSSVTIGNHVLISHNVDIHDTDSHPLDWAARRIDATAIYNGTYFEPTQTLSESIVIEDDVWIGCKATILKGVHIGRGAIIAASSVVTKDVPPFTVVAGNPARIIRQLPESESSEAKFTDEEWERHLPGLKASRSDSMEYEDFEMQLQKKERAIEELNTICQQRMKDSIAKELEIGQLAEACQQRLEKLKANDREINLIRAACEERMEEMNKKMAIHSELRRSFTRLKLIVKWAAILTLGAALIFGTLYWLADHLV